MSEITLALEHPSLGCGEVIARYDLSEIQEKAYQQGRANGAKEFAEYLDNNSYQVSKTIWNDCGHVEDYLGVYDALAEWKKGAENDSSTVN